MLTEIGEPEKEKYVWFHSHVEIKGKHLLGRISGN